MLRIGVFGGTFDPVHLGHLVAAEEASELLALDEMLFVPAGQPWFKAGEPVTDATHRLNMVRLAVESNPRFRVCGVEVARPGPSYTVDTLEHLHDESAARHGDLPGAGAGRAGRDAPLALSGAGVRARHGRGRHAARRGVRPWGRSATVLPCAAERVIMLDVPLVDVGATELRRRASAGRSLRYLVPDGVEAVHTRAWPVQVRRR